MALYPEEDLMEYATNSGAPRGIHRIALAAAASVIGLALLATIGVSPVAASAGPIWSIIASPNTSATQDNVLSAVSCTSPANCVAVGHVNNGIIEGTFDQTLIEMWNGTAWSIIASPNTSATQSNSLLGVSCTSSTACVAVGFSTTGTSVQTFYQALIETWNGTAWSITPSPSAPASQSHFLEAVSCTSPTSCVAVGNVNNSHGDSTLIETWNGTAWSIAPSPNLSATGNDLNGVSCTSPRACVAVGDFYNGTTYQTLVETLKGTDWSTTPSPAPSATLVHSLFAVSCTSPVACVAVGSFNNGTRDQTLAETWNGTAWSVTPSPNPSATLNSLYGVSCTSPTACVAVGYVDQSAKQQTLFETWNGSVWSTTPSPNAAAPGDNNQLSGVSCTSPTACVAVGNVDNGTYSQTLVVSDPLSITTTSLPGGSVWSRAHRLTYSATLAAKGGNPPYKWSLAAGSNPLPPGLKLKAAGSISGRAAAAGTYTFTIQVVDTRTKGSLGHPSTQKATRVLSIRIS
jgi:hypothetical protein